MIVKIASVFCDVKAEGCYGWIGQEETTADARAVARRAGWTWVHGHAGQKGYDVCPSCAGKGSSS